MGEKARKSRSCWVFFCRMTSGVWDRASGNSYRARVWTLEKVSVHFLVMLPVVDGIKVNSKGRTGGIFYLIWDGSENQFDVASELGFLLVNELE